MSKSCGIFRPPQRESALSQASQVLLRLSPHPLRLQETLRGTLFCMRHSHERVLPHETHPASSFAQDAPASAIIERRADARARMRASRNRKMALRPARPECIEATVIPAALRLPDGRPKDKSVVHRGGHDQGAQASPPSLRATRCAIMPLRAAQQDRLITNGSDDARRTWPRGAEGPPALPTFSMCADRPARLAAE